MFSKGGRGKQRGFGFGGFSVASKKETLLQPKVLQSRSQSMKSKDNVKHAPTVALPEKRKPLFVDSDDDDYDEKKFQDDNSDEDTPMYQTNPDDDDEEDELDMFMKGIEQEVKKEESKTEAQRAEEEKKRIQRQDIEEEDDQESYFNYIKNAPVQAYPDDDEVEIDYDSDGNPIVPEKSKIIEPLPRVDHSEIDYLPFEKNFYIEHDEIAKLPVQEVNELRKKLGIKVSGAMPCKPCISFAHFGFDEQLMSIIRKSEYTQPTPIQSQSIPIALTGRDIIGIAKTGSGKTAAYLWPALVHIMDQPELQVGDGPIALICAPTRELCQQIYTEARRFGKAYNIHCVAVFGGGNKYEQSKALQEGAEIVVATPGRLIDHVKSKATNLRRVTFLVFDEADRMFDMGFEPQVRSIANNVRPDRQTLLFSATFKKKVEYLCRDTLTDPIRVVIGELGEANEDVTQVVNIFNSPPEKWTWITENLVSFTSDGSVLIFVTKKANCEELASNLKKNDFEVALLHGDMDQFERNKVLGQFRKKEVPILVATDVAARGLDIPSIKTVINYDVARDITTHTHRIGRTGRAGMKGVAYTLLTSADQNFAGDLVRNLEIANQTVPEPLLELAMKNSWFRKSRFKHGSGKRIDRGGKPRVRERPGLGLPEKTEQTRSGGMATSHASYKPPSGGVFGQPSMGSRTSTVKTAFKSQYMNSFCRASSSSLTSWDSSKSNEPMRPPEQAQLQQKKKKSRWDTGH
ncbi:ATP-dependent RNA helicase DDX42-like [Actinia tenebrosa]|uniref:ATP-dependent RNA helicase DDX42 n=1 Tax=Actinia tenebrosa TaxID=6105 RepID=A0A6P8IYZ7_ACTTE|nr:ATP-dependent RNA helicase DDX42-like [Actinia tenebrosa]